MGSISSSESSIFYEDENIRVIFRPSGGEALIVTFGDMYTLANGERFFADTPLIKLGFSALGFVAKRANWFPQKSMKLAIGRLQGMTDGYRSIIMYGGSMGGYAAIKFSKAFNATKVVAIVPQFSIDPATIEDSRYNKFFDGGLNVDSQISSHDLSGNIEIIYDPYFLKDREHVERIVSLDGGGGKFKIFPFRFTGHHATSILSGTELFHIILSTISTDVYGLNSYMRKQRRKHYRYHDELYQYAALRNPERALLNLSRLLEQTDFSMSNKVVQSVVSLMVSLDINSDRVRQALSIIINKIGASKYQVPEGGGYLRTVHGKILALNLISKRIVQHTGELIDAFDFLVQLRVSGENGLLEILDTDGRACLLISEKDDVSVYRGAEIFNGKNFIAYFSAEGKFILTSNGKNLTAYPGGSCSFRFDYVKNWETFAEVSSS